MDSGPTCSICFKGSALTTKKPALRLSSNPVLIRLALTTLQTFDWQGEYVAFFVLRVLTCVQREASPLSSKTAFWPTWILRTEKSGFKQVWQHAPYSCTALLSTIRVRHQSESSTRLSAASFVLDFPTQVCNSFLSQRHLLIMNRCRDPSVGSDALR